MQYYKQYRLCEAINTQNTYNRDSEQKKCRAAEVSTFLHQLQVRYCKVHWSGSTFGSEPGIEIILADLSSQPETSD